MDLYCQKHETQKIQSLCSSLKDWGMIMENFEKGVPNHPPTFQIGSQTNLHF